ncbi:hypothetical protein DFJ58DRAFT_810447 [Suillus subalutaceus]|uniref:uncharacterized protein n=1 Tax=Suillus subalutaceus TaxID=48586 RepID=UPI001B866DB8|nr:uncharacterized protein DFJ58DRAFT_810447 [Suillus subalutaceus]KAG1840479.1 hypothetical protein DFJ58DRAFT_810447 [Suillus subalutaceus]
MANLATIETGTVTVNDVPHNITPKVNFTKDYTHYFALNSQLSACSTTRPSTSADPCSAHGCEISVLEMSTLQGVQLPHDTLPNSNSGGVGVPGLLNFGDAISPGRGFLIGLAT